MDKTLHNESDIVEKILALSITDLEDVYMLIQLIQSYQSETVELSEDYDNKNINLIHKYC